MHKSTHWCCEEDPEEWKDDPETDPIKAAEQAFEDYGLRDELADMGSCNITVHGWVKTKDRLDPELVFDGYKPGDDYYVPTGETAIVTISRSSHLDGIFPKRGTHD